MGQNKHHLQLGTCLPGLCHFYNLVKAGQNNQAELLPLCAINIYEALSGNCKVLYAKVLYYI